MKENKPNTALKKYSIWIQIIIGVICGFLNLLFSRYTTKLGIPLFMDCLFTVTATFFGWISGIISMIILNVVSVLITDDHQYCALLFAICVLSMILIIRLFLKNKEKVTFLHLVIITLLSIFFVSLTGAIIFTFCFAEFEYKEAIATRYMTYILLQQKIPVLFSSFISRIPVNCIDKTIAVFGGYGIYLLADKLISKISK